jgi:beta-lactamase class A
VKHRLAADFLLLALGALLLVTGMAIGAHVDVSPSSRVEAGEAVTAQPTLAESTPATPDPILAPTPAPRSPASLEAQVSQLLRQGGASGGVSLVELTGAASTSWSLDGDQSFLAASTYKLPLLMEEAQNITAGHASPNDQLCYEAGDWEDGYYSDYQPGDCYTRAELERRVGADSDNTAARILVRYGGGTAALNAYARAHGATESAFYDPNETTSNDLARLWVNEARGSAGGARAQAYLYPLLTRTAYEQGIPAGVPAGTTVVHKIGGLGSELNDAALVLAGPRGPYVLTVCIERGSWQLIAQVAQAVSRFEAI